MSGQISDQNARILSQSNSLKASEESLRRLADNAYGIVTQTDPDGIILYVSSSYKWVLGIGPEALIGTTIFERLHPDDITEARATFFRAMAGGDWPASFALRYRHADGHYLWMECNGNILINKQGESAGAVLYSREIIERIGTTDEPRLHNPELENCVRERTANFRAEIAERKRIEKALRDSEERYRAIWHQSLEAIYIHDVETLQLLEANPAFLTLLGYEAEEIKNLSLYDIVAADKDSIENFQQKILNSEGIILGERLWRRKDGTTVEVEVTANKIGQDGRETVFVVARDITKRKRAKMALRESEERYALAVRGANDGLWDWDIKTDEIYFSPRWSSMLGFEENEIGNTLEEWFDRVHPQDLLQLKAAVSRHLDGSTPHFECEYRIQHANKDYLWVLSRGLAVRNEDGEAYRMAGSQTDVTDHKRTEERLAHDALHDALTGLPNRVLFMDRLGQRLEHAKRHPDNLFAVLFIDLDRFKIINDSLGHFVGDKFLASTAQQLRSCLRPADSISRLGGDEFAVLLNEINEVSDTIRVAERIQAQLMSTTMLEVVNRSSTASIGIAMYNRNYTEPQEILRDADSAMYRAKALGGGRYQLFDATMYENALSLLQLEADLKLAVENREWLVHYQPIISLESGNITGVEALLRWKHPKRGIILPLSFVPVAEETGLILQIGEYVLREACARAKVWRDSGYPKLWVSVNISGRQFQDKNLIKVVEQALSTTGLPSDGLRLEITESVAMKDLAHSINILNDLNKLGVSISLDDFGIGYSSLSYLKQFPLKVLKIDRSFIQDNDIRKNGEAITSAIIFMGQTLNLEVVAEGVETEEQLNFLKSQFCDEAQGFLFSRPLPGEELGELLNDKKNFIRP